LDTVESLDWKAVIVVIESYGYTIANPKRFIKQLTDLYTTKQQKMYFLGYMKNNIEHPVQKH